MKSILITGSSGLIGAEACRFFAQKGYRILGIDNNLRKYFFGEDGSVEWQKKKLIEELENYQHFDIDIRDQSEIEKVFSEYSSDIECVIHTAAQPSHDWAAKEPLTDFTVNANGTLVLLESFRKYCEKSCFIFTSTNKVYGDLPNSLPLVENDKRWEIDQNHKYFEHGIDEEMSIDQSKHSLFGASKVAADILTQEYGRYFGLNTVVFRGGCLTGPGHSGAELHGFLAYLVKCVVLGKPYTVFGYGGKQVRDNIHSFDLVNAFYHYMKNPKSGEVYNIGGSRHSHCSMLEAIDLIESKAGKKLDFSISQDNRIGDHIWYVSDVRKFSQHYPEWGYKYDLSALLDEIIDAVS